MNKKFKKMLKKINWHTVRTISLIVIAFVVGGLQGIHASIPPGMAGTVDAVVAFLLFVEHQFAGNSRLTS